MTPSSLSVHGAAHCSRPGQAQCLLRL
jgi:hypothetical protein